MKLCLEVQDISLAHGQNHHLEDLGPLGPGLQEQNMNAGRKMDLWYLLWKVLLNQTVMVSKKRGNAA